MQAIGDIPGFEGTYDMELAGAIHGVIDLWILGKLFKGARHTIWFFLLHIAMPQDDAGGDLITTELMHRLRLQLVARRVLPSMAR